LTEKQLSTIVPDKTLFCKAEYLPVLGSFVFKIVSGCPPFKKIRAPMIKRRFMSFGEEAAINAEGLLGEGVYGTGADQ
jgi:hypothetical protein